MQGQRPNSQWNGNAASICPVCGSEMNERGRCYNHCPYCFKPLQPGTQCSCKYSQRSIPLNTLPMGTPLENGKYIIGAVLGKGGFGITYLGFQPALKSYVAIKEYFPEELVTRSHSSYPNQVTARSPLYEGFLDRFKREAKILRDLNQLPNTVTVYDLIEENNTAYIIMEFIQGESLKEMMDRKGGRLQWPELWQVIDPILGSLEAIHERKIIHRDISPDNILIDAYGKPLLIDFGAARIGQSTSGTIAVGKVGYAPLEQISGDSQDLRTDIYSLGATLYKVLTGVTPQSAQARSVRDDLQPVSSLAPDVPKHVSDAIAKALSIQLANRWNSVREFRDALAAGPVGTVTDDTDLKPNITVTPDSPGSTGPLPKVKKKSAGTVILRILLILLVLLVAGFLVITLRFPQYLDFAEPLYKGLIQKDAESQIWIGNQFRLGENGVGQNKSFACFWYRRAADLEDPEGEYNLGLCYRDGYGVEMSETDYVSWLEKAAEQGYIRAIDDLIFYYHDQGDTDQESYWQSRLN